MEKEMLKGCQSKNCRRKGELLSLTEFYRHSNGAYYTKCKECHRAEVKFNNEQKAIKAGQQAYKEKLIMESEIDDAISLFKSCRSRINACKHNIGIYKDVSCDWDDPYQFLKDILTVRENRKYSYWDRLWSDWKAQRKIYLETGREEEKPELDRILGGDSPYTIGNIRCLSDYWNRENAKPITPLRIRLYKNCQLVIERHFAEVDKARKWIETETEIKCSWNKIKENIDKGIILLKEGYSMEILSLEAMLEEHEAEQGSPKDDSI